MTKYEIGISAIMIIIVNKNKEMLKEKVIIINIIIHTNMAISWHYLAYIQAGHLFFVFRVECQILNNVFH